MEPLRCHFYVTMCTWKWTYVRLVQFGEKGGDNVWMYNNPFTRPEYQINWKELAQTSEDAKQNVEDHLTWLTLHKRLLRGERLRVLDRMVTLLQKNPEDQVYFAHIGEEKKKIETSLKEEEDFVNSYLFDEKDSGFKIQYASCMLEHGYVDLESLRQVTREDLKKIIQRPGHVIWLHHKMKSYVGVCESRVHENDLKCSDSLNMNSKVLSKVNVDVLFEDKYRNDLLSFSSSLSQCK
jgi:hypothetical protein